MKLKLPIIALASCLCYGINAQTGTSKISIPLQDEGPKITKRTCGAEVPSAEWDAWFNKKVEEFIAAQGSAKTQTTNFVIPVVVHVIHGGQAVGTYPNIKQGQVNSQIDVLNADYAGNGYNVGNVPAVFSTLIANTNITFCLAARDTGGHPMAEPGIDRVNYVSRGWTSPAASAYNTPTTFQNYINGTIKPGTIWDPTRFMNIWVTDENANTGLLGYATFPSGTGLTGLSGFGSSTTDGLWCWAKSFGSAVVFPSGTYDPIYNLGRTASHEIGHWVGLRHTWGDGTCATDYCNDTPPAQQANYGCPAFPHNLGTCTGNTTGEMTMNFMDYSDDACMYMFTNDQNTRIQTAMANGTYRSQLTASSATLCGAPPVAHFGLISDACASDVVVASDSSSGSGTLVYSWSANPSTGVNFNTSSTASPTLSFSASGTYTIVMVVSNDFGPDTVSKVVQVNTCLGLKQNSLLDKNIRLVPNPSSGIVNIISTQSNTQALEISINNSLGQLVSTTKYNTVAGNTLTLDLGSYSNGVYFVTINNGLEKIVKRLILSK